ncbi:reverse transcriptase domain-containing protein [Tanacetum coccineum]
MQVKDIHDFVDSKLVASQVKGSYEAKGERMIKYREKVLELVGAFNRFRIIYIPREENKKADALSKLAAVQFDHLSKEVLVEVLNESSVVAQEEVLLGSIDEVVAKAMNLGYYWPSMYRDVSELIRACDDCLAHVFVPRLPKADMISVTSAWPFMKFGIPTTIITYNGTQFVNDPFKKWAEKLKIQLISTSVYHPQGNGAVERANKSLLRGIKTRLEKGGSAWAEEVPNVLWAHRTMKKTINGKTPFSLTYGTEVVIPAEIGMPTYRTSSVNEKTNDQELHLNLDLLDERREIAAIREARYKQQVEKYYNKKDPLGKDLTKLSKHSKVELISKVTWKGKRYLGPGMLVTFEGATCKTTEYLYFYYVSLLEKQFSKYRLALEVTLYIIDVLFLLA